MGRPEYLRQQTKLSLRKLKVDTLYLLQLHRIAARRIWQSQFGVLRGLQDEGNVQSLGLSQVSVAELEAAGKYFTVSTVQNRYTLTDRGSEDVPMLSATATASPARTRSPARAWRRKT